MPVEFREDRLPSARRRPSSSSSRHRGRPHPPISTTPPLGLKKLKKQAVPMQKQSVSQQEKEVLDIDTTENRMKANKKEVESGSNGKKETGGS